MTVLFHVQFYLTFIFLTVGHISLYPAEKNQTTGPNISAIAKYFSTKGRYEEVNPYLLDNILAVNKILKRPSEECHAIHLTAIIRHGTRYPSAKNIEKMQELYSLVLKTQPHVVGLNGGNSWLGEIRNQWTMWYTKDLDGHLAPKGFDDLRHLASRLSVSFSTILSKDNLRNGRIKFITSSKHRCVNSTIAFKDGLKHVWKLEDAVLDHDVNDSLMRFFDQCARFVHDVEKNPNALVEVDSFKSGAEMKRVREKIADRLQVPYSNITADIAEAAFYLCAYELAIKNLNSPWCSLFDDVDAQVMEYVNDLKQFWKRGYGYNINSKASCILYHDIIRCLDRAANESKLGNVTEAAVIQVGHADTLLPLLTLLGFFKDDDNLTSSNFAAQAGRLFRPGRIVPYAANLLLVLYACGEQLRLQPLLNEQPLTFPNFTEAAPLYLHVRSYYNNLLQDCNFEEECKLPGPK